MWRKRYNDLWMYPLPRWFVHICNRTIGAYVLDVIFAAAVVGMIGLVAGLLFNISWLQTVAWILIAPTWMFILMSLITAQYREMTYRRDQSNNDVEAP